MTIATFQVFKGKILIFTIKSELFKVFEVQMALDLCRNTFKTVTCSCGKMFAQNLSI